METYPRNNFYYSNLPGGYEIAIKIFTMNFNSIFKWPLFKKGFSIISIFILLCFSLSNKIFCQIRTSWFDINPSSSNTDNINPNGSSGGRTNHVGASSDIRQIYAATEWGGLWQSFDQGLTWVKVNSFTPSATWDVKVDPRNSKKVYATSFFDGRAVTRITRSRSGISISTDAGGTWSNAPYPTLPCAVAARATEPSAWQISINPNNTQVVFVGTNCGLARTFDGGNIWTYVDPSPADGSAEQIYAVVAHGDSIVDVIGDNGHFRSTNDGNTWTSIPAGAVGLAGGIGSIAVSPAENYVLFATVGANIFESDNAGQSWATSLAAPVANRQGRIPFVKTNQRITSNQFDLWFGDVSVFSTTATTPAPPAIGGATRVPVAPSWTNMQSGAHNDVGDMLFDPRATADACPLLFTNDGGIYRNLLINSPGCETPSWEQPNSTTHATWVFGFDGAQNAPGQHAIYYGLQDDGSWGTVNAQEGPINPVPNWNNNACCDVGSDAAQSDLILDVEGFFGPPRPFQLFRRGPNFTGGGQIPNYPSTGNFGSFISGREVVRIGNNAFAIALSDAAYFTNNINDNPIKWTTLGAPTAPNSQVGGLKVSTVGGPTSIYYYTGSGNPNGAPGQVFRTDLLGQSGWVQLPLPPNINSVSVYDVDPADGNKLMISGINQLTNTFSTWKTIDYGLNWTPMNQLDNLMVGGGVFQNLVNTGPTNFTGFGSYWQPYLFEFNPANPNTVVAGAADAGVFLTTDFGNNWQLISNPINPSSNSSVPHIARPVAAYFSPTRFNANTTAFDVWIASQGAGVEKVLVESP